MLGGYLTNLKIFINYYIEHIYIYDYHVLFFQKPSPTSYVGISKHL
jgi:hypothetical protein